ncbi:MAG: HD domain-containing phosphohydrolase [Succinivibrio sp.]
MIDQLKKVTILIIDDDNFSQKIVNKILSASLSDGSRVQSAHDGLAGVEFMSRTPADLVLLDMVMPGIDGLETLRRIRAIPGCADVPVIMMSATISQDLEAEAFRNGATDFIHKPFTADVITLRIERQLRLAYLTGNLNHEVARQTALATERLKSNIRLFNETVLALANTIDAKDPYTSGHSVRVADYSRTISKLSGDTKEYQNSIYYSGLLHDIGKIGIPIEIIDKTSRLSDDEYEKMKAHTIIGAKILSYIKDFPELSYGAHYHHERYDGKGYPEGLKGEAIPRQARIIGLADAYDAMTSRRSYRDCLPQDVVREQIAKGAGTQFDPQFVKILLKMIDMDKDYRMRQF